MGHLYTDCLILGGGVAGLRAALSVASEGRKAILLVKDNLSESNSFYAQGGIAAVTAADDTFESHIEDTLKTGCGLCDRQAVELVIRSGPGQIDQLLEWQTPFDRIETGLARGREGGHSHSRILHAYGDATGRAIVETLRNQVRLNHDIKIFDHCFSIDLLTQDGCCYGVLTYHPKHGYQCIWARRTILATGGAGRLYRETTNPEGATADGLAMAYRAGAVLSDMEFMQFHPTTLYIAGAERKLITEALRGAGGYLVDRGGRRFMTDYHDMAELAPRDVVSRAIYEEIRKANATNMYLDIRHLGAAWLSERFPTISELCRQFDIDVDKDLIPIRPSAHYMIGGVKTDLEGRTSVRNLYCCGEAACTGLHGSNRLASNSLLEGLVFGQICGENALAEILSETGEVQWKTIVFDIPDSQRTRLDIEDVTNSLRAVMWRNVGMVRNWERLQETLEIIDFWRRYVLDKVFNDVPGWQCQNMLTVARMMAESALKRQESRGVHYRSDYPQTDDGHFLRHLDIGPMLF